MIFAVEMQRLFLHRQLDKNHYFFTSLEVSFCLFQSRETIKDASQKASMNDPVFLYNQLLIIFLIF